MLVNITGTDVARASLKHRAKPIEWCDEKNQILKPNTGKSLPINFASHTSGLIGTDHIAEIQKSGKHLPEAAASLKKIGGGFYFLTSPAADGDQQREIRDKNKPIDDM